jgi:hypothetical protein
MSPIEPAGTDNDIYDNTFLNIHGYSNSSRMVIFIIYFIVVSVSALVLLTINSSKKYRHVLGNIKNRLLNGNPRVMVPLAGIVSCCMNPAIWSYACISFPCFIPIYMPWYFVLCLSSALFSTFTILYASTCKRHYKISLPAFGFAMIFSIVSIASILPLMTMLGM